MAYSRLATFTPNNPQGPAVLPSYSGAKNNSVLNKSPQKIDFAKASSVLTGLPSIISNFSSAYTAPKPTTIPAQSVALHTLPGRTTIPTSSVLDFGSVNTNRLYSPPALVASPSLLTSPTRAIPPSSNLVTNSRPRDIPSSITPNSFSFNWHPVDLTPRRFDTPTRFVTDPLHGSVLPRLDQVPRFSGGIATSPVFPGSLIGTILDIPNLNGSRPPGSIDSILNNYHPDRFIGSNLLDSVVPRPVSGPNHIPGDGLSSVRQNSAGITLDPIPRTDLILSQILGSQNIAGALFPTSSSASPASTMPGTQVAHEAKAYSNEEYKEEKAVNDAWRDRQVAESEIIGHQIERSARNESATAQNASLANYLSLLSTARARNETPHYYADATYGVKIHTPGEQQFSVSGSAHA